VGGTTGPSGGTTTAGGTTGQSGGATTAGGATGKSGGTTGPKRRPPLADRPPPVLAVLVEPSIPAARPARAALAARSRRPAPAEPAAPAELGPQADPAPRVAPAARVGPVRLAALPAHSSCGRCRGCGRDSHRLWPWRDQIPRPPTRAGITFKDTDGDLVNAHGGGIIRVCNTFYLHGEYFLSTTTDNDFNGLFDVLVPDFGDMEEGGQQGDQSCPSNRAASSGRTEKGRGRTSSSVPPPGNSFFTLIPPTSTYQADKEVVYATSPTVNAVYSFKGSLLSSSGAICRPQRT